MKNILFILVLFSLPGYGQLEMANWHFGNTAALDFGSGCPMSLNGTRLNTIESCSSISTSTGFLQFYTDGVTVYTRNHTIMTDGEGLLGLESSTGGALIVPFPNNPQRYYLFTGDAVQNYQDNNSAGVGKGINYSVVDMTSAGGAGAVIIKNTNILEQGSEKLSAVRHSNGTDYWVLTHYENRFYAFPVTSGGVGAPVITTIGISVTNFNNFRGVIKFSPDGSKVGVCHTTFEPSLGGQLALYDFDASTGVLSNQEVLGNDLVYYGVEFSPNSEVLYASGKEAINGGDDTGDTKLLQFDLQATNVQASRFEVANFLAGPMIDLAGGIQVSIDTKLYQSIGGARLNVIRQPNRLGADCDFQFRAVALGLNSARLGLTNGVQSYYENIIEYEDLCLGETTSFFLNTSRAISSAVWDFGDPASGASNTSTLINPTHSFSSADSYTVSCTVTYSDGEVRVYKVIIKSIIAPVLVPAILTQCDTDGVDDGQARFNLLEALDLVFVQDVSDPTSIVLKFYETEADAMAQINAIETPQNYESLFDGQVIYTSVFQSLDCFITTTVTLNVEAGALLPPFDLIVCASVIGEESWVVQVASVIAGVQELYPNEEIRIYESLEDAGLQVGEQMGSQVFAFSEPSFFYYRLGALDECVGVGRVDLIIEDPLELEDEVVFLCYTEDGTILEGPPGYPEYEWSTGATTQAIAIEEPGIYSLTVRLYAGCSGVLNYTVTEGALLQAEIIVNDFQQNNEIIINATISEGNILYSIDGGITFQNSSRFGDLSPGEYDVVVVDEAGCNAIRETVSVRGAPRFFTPNNDGRNDRWHIIDAQDYEGMEIEIFDRYGKRLDSLTSNSQGWDGMYNGKRLASSTYWYSVKYQGKTNYGYFALLGRDL